MEIAIQSVHATIKIFMQLYIHALKRHYKTLRLYSPVDFEHDKTQTKKVLSVLCELVLPGYFFMASY